MLTWRYRSKGLLSEGVPVSRIATSEVLTAVTVASVFLASGARSAVLSAWLSSTMTTCEQLTMGDQFHASLTFLALMANL
jgi:hypothetical protein